MPYTIKTNFQGHTRREQFEGVEHLVAPVVMIVDGVLNEALVTHDEYGAFVEAWNGRPVPVLHPEKNGGYVSANSPDIIEKNTIGTVFNTHVEDGKLKAELWLNTEKAQRLGYCDLLAQIEQGEVIEVSTGYFCDAEAQAGIFNGHAYREIHRNIRPDHLALLPGEIGACSVADGCGTRVNKSFAINVLNSIAQAVGLRVNDEGGQTMSDKEKLLERAKKLRANEKLSADQMQMLQDLAEDEQQLKMARAFLDAVEVDAQPEPPAPDEMAEDEEFMATLSANQKFVQKFQAKLSTGDDDQDAIIAQKVDEQVRRREVTSKLKVNERCPFDEKEMATMSVEHLEKLEESIRPQDYSGQGGFATNSDSIDADVQPLTNHKGVLTPKQQEA